MDLYVKIDSSEPLDVTLVKGKVPHMEHHRWSKCGSEYFYFILFLFHKLRQTNKQTERTLAGTPQQMLPITADLDAKKKEKKERLKSTVIQEKLQLCTTSYWTRQGMSTITF